MGKTEAFELILHTPVHCSDPYIEHRTELLLISISICLSERLNASTRQNWSLHPADGEGGGDESENVFCHNNRLSHLLGPALLCDSCQLGLGLGGC